MKEINAYQKNVKKIRVSLKMSQQKLSNSLNIKRVTLGSYEEGRANMPLDILKQVIDKFEIDKNKIYDILFNEDFEISDLKNKK